MNHIYSIVSISPNFRVSVIIGLLLNLSLSLLPRILAYFFLAQRTVAVFLY